MFCHVDTTFHIRCFAYQCPLKTVGPGFFYVDATFHIRCFCLPTLSSQNSRSSVCHVDATFHTSQNSLSNVLPRRRNFSHQVLCLPLSSHSRSSVLPVEDSKAPDAKSCVDVAKHWT